MDQELVQYLDGRFQTLDQRFSTIDERFDHIEQRLDSHDQRFNTIDQRFDRIEQRLDAHDQKFRSIDERFDRVGQQLDTHDDRFDEVKRHTGVLVEGLRHEIQLVAEGLAMHIQVQHVQEREYHDQQHQETHALIRSFYDELKQQNTQLRQRVDRLEQKGQA